MIALDNFQKVLKSLGFAEKQNVFSKSFGSLVECMMEVNWNKGELIYPEAIIINDKTSYVM